MKKTIITSLLLLMLVISVLGQSELREKIENRKIAMITQKLDLTPEQAEKFWPVYREFDKKRVNINQDFAQRRRSFDPTSASDEETRQMIELGLQVRERQLNLEKDYSERLRQVITDRQILTLRKAEEDFKQMLLERVRERRQQMQRSREQNERTKTRRRNN